MIELAIFDLAGTIVDEDNLVYKNIVTAFDQEGIDITLATVLEKAAGKEKWFAIHDLLKDTTTLDDEERAEKTNDIHSVFLRNLVKSYQEYEIKLFDDCRPLFEFLKENNIKQAVNTGYSRRIAEIILKKVDFIEGRDFDLLCTADDVFEARPAPDMILKICKELKIDAKNSIKVGDSAVDILEGKNAQVYLSIGITTGAQTVEQMAKEGPDFIVHSLSELQEVILGEI